MSSQSIDRQVFDELRKYDTPTVLNVIELFDARGREEGFLDGRIKACFPEMGPIVGYATTATFTSARPAAAGDACTLLGDQVAAFNDMPKPRIVVFQDIDPEPVGATFGEVMCTVYKAFDCVGLITSGGARDLDQVRAIDFPCWSSSVISSHAWCRIVDVQVPVEVGGAKILPGDVIHADCNGVAILPSGLVEEVALGCKYLVEAENIILGYARGENPGVDGLRDAHNATKQRFAEIPAQVRAELGR
jgi:regulator of RNase E activity RraA